MDYIIQYVELKSSNHTDADEAWIARVWPSSSGKTIYFNGMALKRAKGSDSNHYDLVTGDLYWVSGVKKRGTNRHWGGSIYEETRVLFGLPELSRGSNSINRLCKQLPFRFAQEDPFLPFLRVRF
jgi:hypothetical protein